MASPDLINAPDDLLNPIDSTVQSCHIVSSNDSYVLNCNDPYFFDQNVVRETASTDINVQPSPLIQPNSVTLTAPEQIDNPSLDSFETLLNQQDSFNTTQLENSTIDNIDIQFPTDQSISKVQPTENQTGQLHNHLLHNNSSSEMLDESALFHFSILGQETTPLIDFDIHLLPPEVMPDVMKPCYTEYEGDKPAILDKKARLSDKQRCKLYREKKKKEKQDTETELKSLELKNAVLKSKESHLTERVAKIRTMVEHYFLQDRETQLKLADQIKIEFI